MAVANYTPSVEDVANLTFARTKGRWGGGDVTANPPGFADPLRVRNAIGRAVAIIAPQLGGNKLDPHFWDAAKGVISFWVAWELEIGGWPEQTRKDPMIAEQWKVMFDESLAALSAAIVRYRDDGDDGGPGASALPAGAFPAPGIPRRTVFGFLSLEDAARGVGRGQDW